MKEIIEKIKGYLPYIAGLVFVSCIVFYPELQGKKLGAADAISNVAGAKEIEDYVGKGELIKWTNRVFSGMPTYGSGGNEEIAHNWVVRVYNKVLYALPSFFSFWLVLVLCCFFSLLILRVDKKLSFILSIALGLNTWVLDSLWASHPTKIMSLGFIMLVVSGLISFLSERRWIGLVYIMIGLNFALANGHYQIIYYGMILCVIFTLYFVWKAIKEKTIKEIFYKGLILVPITIIPVVMFGPVLYITNDYNKETMRGGKTELVKPEANSTAEGGGLDINYAFSWSYSIPELFNFIVPDAMGGSGHYHIKSNKTKLAELQAQQNGEAEQVLPYYWGIQPFTGAPNYLGAGIIFLFIFSLFYWKNNIKWVFLTISLLSISMGLGRSFLGFNEIIFNYLPLYNKFRTPTMAFSIFNIMSLMSIGLGLNSFFKEDIDKDESLKCLKKSGIVFVILMLIGYFAVSSEGFISEVELRQYADNPNILDIFREDRISLLKSDWIRSLFILCIVFGSIFAYLKNKLSAKILYIVLGLLIFIDLFTVYKRYLTVDVFQKVEKTDDMIPHEPYHDEIAKDKSYFRIFNTVNQNLFSDNTDGYYFSNVGGYSPAKLYRYQDLIDVHLGRGNMSVLNMLNTKYFIVENQGQKIPQINPNACGNAWFVSEVKFAKNANEEMDSIGTFNPKQTAWIDQRYKSESKFDGNKDLNAKIELVKYHPENMEYSSVSTTGGFAVFSEIWYKGNEDWKIFIDGKESKMIRTDYLLRGAYIPAGNHKIEMKFNADKLQPYMVARTIATLLFCLIIVFIFYYDRKQKIN